MSDHQDHSRSPSFEESFERAKASCIVQQDELRASIKNQIEFKQAFQELLSSCEAGSVHDDGSYVVDANNLQRFINAQFRARAALERAS